MLWSYYTVEGEQVQARQPYLRAVPPPAYPHRSGQTGGRQCRAGASDAPRPCHGREQHGLYAHAARALPGAQA